MLKLSNKVALITGAAKGIGRATAKLFHQQNAHVVAVDLDLDGLKSLQSELGNNNIDIFEADVSNETEVKNYIDKTYNNCGKINILCNIAGGHRLDNLVSRFHTTDLSRMRKTYDINLWGSLYNCYYAVPYMLETVEKEKTNNKDGKSNNNDNNDNNNNTKLATPCCIVNTSSIAAERAAPGYTDYTISKHGVNGLTYSIAAEYSSLGIRCNGIIPSIIDTPLSRDLFEKTKEFVGDEIVEQISKGFISQIGLKRRGTAEEIANAILFLSSDEASFITGSVLLADGGFVKIIVPP